VLRMHALQGEPATDVVPAIRRLYDQALGRLLHHGIVNANLLQVGIFAAQDLVAVRRCPGVRDAADGRVQLGFVFLQRLQDRRRLPDEDAAVPEVFARLDVAAGLRLLRLLAELAHAVDADALA